MDPVDAAWYRMDRPRNPAVVTGLLLFEGSIDTETVDRIFSERLLPFTRFQYRVVERGWPWALPYWESDPDFALDRHIHLHSLTPPYSKDRLLDLAGTLASKPLPSDRPPWAAHVITISPSRSALVMRFHHCMADGTASVALADTLLDRPGSETDDRPPRQSLSSLPESASLVERTSSYAVRAVRTGVRSLLQPSRTLRRLPSILDRARVAVESVLTSSEPASPLRRPLTGTRRLSYTSPVEVETLKAIGAPAEATINDVMVTALAGAVRRELLDDELTSSIPPVRAIVPVDLRSATQALELGNAFGLTFLSLPIDETTPMDRLRTAKERMDAIKQSPEASVFFHILGLFGQLPHAVQDLASSFFANKASMVMTNVVGPTNDRTLAGHSVENMVFWVPHPVSLGTGISILSYGGRVSVGVVADAGIGLDPRRLTAGIETELDVLATRAGARDSGEQDTVPAVPYKSG